MGDGDSGYKWCKKCKRWGCECFALPEVICEQCGKGESECICDVASLRLQPKPRFDEVYRKGLENMSELKPGLLTPNEMAKAIIGTSSPPHEATAKAQFVKDIKWLKTQHLQVIGVEDSLNCFVIPVSEVIELEGKT